MEYKCENACSNKDECFVDKWFTCEHYACKRTVIVLNYCIACGNTERSKLFVKRCAWCQGVLTDNEKNVGRTLCLENMCYLECHLKDKNTRRLGSV